MPRHAGAVPTGSVLTAGPGDTAGATLGPLIAWFLLSAAMGLDVRTVFTLAAIPGVLGVITLLVFVREKPRAAAKAPAKDKLTLSGSLPSRLWAFLAVLFV